MMFAHANEDYKAWTTIHPPPPPPKKRSGILGRQYKLRQGQE